MRWLQGATASLSIFAGLGFHQSLAAQQLQGAPPPLVEATAPGDTVVLSLADAVARATGTSEEVRLARSQVDLADVEVQTVRSGALPQISGSLGYTRTFQSQFNTGGGFETPDSLKFEPDSLAPLDQRVSYLEEHAETAGLGGLGSLFGDLPFGQAHQFTYAISGSQVLWAGGRLGAAMQTARHFRTAAELQLDEETADVELNVRTAYQRALLATELERISAAAVEQADRFLAQEQLRHKSGSASELDVLRAEVESANLRPQLIEAENAASLALLELRRLVNLPADQPVQLSSVLQVPSADELREPAVDSITLQERAAVLGAERQVRMRELGVRVAKSYFWPTASLRINYGSFLYPIGAFAWGGNPWRSDFTASITVDVPIFDGLRRQADVHRAQVELERARLQLTQLEEGVRVQYEQALGERRRAAAAIEARQRTVDQAQRVYDLTVLRYDRGLATQLEVSDARLALLQASTNLAQALTDFNIADARLQRSLTRGGTASR